MLKRHFLICFLFLTGTLFVSAQSLSPAVISSSGGSGEANGTLLSWTIGETMTQTFSSDTLLLTQGFQQGYFSITTSLDELTGLGFKVNLYPNPVNQDLNIEFSENPTSQVQLKLMDLTGKVIVTRIVNSPSNILRLNMNDLTAGVYFLEIRMQMKRTVFKILKH